MKLFPVLILGLAASLQAAPKLRLTTTTVGPLSITQGANSNPRIIEAYNAGDGNLSLTVSSSVSWLTATVGTPSGCLTQGGICFPISLGFNTASLAKGSFTGVITVSDPNALDAPQNITVTVTIGGAVPDSVNLYVAPNGIDQTVFTTNNAIDAFASTQSGGPWLSVAMDGVGTFRFPLPFHISAKHQEGMPEGIYNGSVVISGSNVGADNKTVPVRLQVTSQPIARVTPVQLNFRISTGAPVQQAFLNVYNSGLGTASVSGVSVATASGGNWLTAEAGGNTISVKADGKDLAAGSYAGTITINTNGVNGSLTVPVALNVIAQGPPFAVFSGLLNSGNYDEGLAPGSVAALFGEQLSYSDPARASGVPLGTDLNGTRVLVNDVAAPLYYASYGQINFQIPFELQPGEAVVRVERGGQRGNGLSVLLGQRAPRIIQVGDSGVIVNPDGSLAMRGGRTAKVGEAITIYCVGLGPTNPGAVTGGAAPLQEPLARVQANVRVVLGNAFSGVVVVDPLYVGLTPSLVGLYQVNVVLPPETPRGDISMALEGDGFRSNQVILPIQ